MSEHLPAEFVVYDEYRRAYVESIDTYDGNTEWTTNPNHARFFRGQTWADFWTRDGLRLIPAKEAGNATVATDS